MSKGSVGFIGVNFIGQKGLSLSTPIISALWCTKSTWWLALAR